MKRKSEQFSQPPEQHKSHYLKSPPTANKVQRTYGLYLPILSRSSWIQLKGVWLENTEYLDTKLTHSSALKYTGFTNQSDMWIAVHCLNTTNAALSSRCEQLTHWKPIKLAATMLLPGLLLGHCYVVATVLLKVARAFSGCFGWLLVGYMLVYIKKATSRCEQLT